MNLDAVVGIVPKLLTARVLLTMAIALGLVYTVRLRYSFCSTIPRRIRVQQAISMLLLCAFYTLILVYPNPDKMEIKVAFSRVAVAHILMTHIWVQLWSLLAYWRRVNNG